MLRTLHKTMGVALAILCVAFTVARAADETLSGTVQNVDPQQGRLTVKAGEDNVVELRAPAALLSDLQSGDAVEVKRAGQHAIFIRRQEGVQRPDIGGALRLQPPVEPPQSR
jgi:Cu/Ag efflux protein CusF